MVPRSSSKLPGALPLHQINENQVLILRRENTVVFRRIPVAAVEAVIPTRDLDEDMMKAQETLQASVEMGIRLRTRMVIRVRAPKMMEWMIAVGV
jgi:hypothetical protein